MFFVTRFNALLVTKNTRVNVDNPLEALKYCLTGQTLNLPHRQIALECIPRHSPQYVFLTHLNVAPITYNASML